MPDSRRQRGRTKRISKGDAVSADYLNGLVRAINANTRNVRGPHQKKVSRDGSIGRPEIPTGSVFQAILIPVDFVAACSVTADAAFSVDWGDGTPIAYAADETPSVVPTSPGPITFTSSASPTFFRNINDTISEITITGASSLTTMFNGTFGSFEDNIALTTFSIDDTSNVTNFQAAWSDCRNLNPFPLIDVTAGTNFKQTWKRCRAIVNFPNLTFTLGVDFTEAFNQHFAATSFPALSFPAGRDFTQAWSACTGLTSFPNIDLSAATSLSSAWNGCSGLTSFSLTDFSACTNFLQTFEACSSLTSLGNLQTEAGTAFGSMFQNCSSLTSIGAIDTTNTSGLSINMFNNTGSLTSPDSATQVLLASIAGFDFN